MGKKITVERVLFPFVRSDFGGSYVSSALLIRGLIEKGVSVDAIFPYPGPGYYHFISSGISADLLFKKKPCQLFYYTAILFLIFQYLNKKRFQIFHCNDDRTILIWGLIGRIFRVKVIWHVRNSHGSKFDCFRLLLSHCRIFVSEFTANRLKYKSNKHVIYNPVGYENWNNNGRVLRSCASKLIDPEVIILHVGRDSPSKRLDWTVQSVVSVNQESNIKIRLAILGDISAARRLEIQEYWSKSGLDITSLHFCSRSKYVSTWMLLSDFVSHPADGRYFGLDRVVQEAIVCNKPILCTDTGANPELNKYGVNLIRYSQNSFASFLTHFRQLISDCSDRHSVSQQQPRIHEIKDFSISSHTDEILKAYRNL